MSISKGGGGKKGGFFIRNTQGIVIDFDKWLEINQNNSKIVKKLHSSLSFRKHDQNIWHARQKIFRPEFPENLARNIVDDQQMGTGSLRPNQDIPPLKTHANVCILLSVVKVKSPNFRFQKTLYFLLWTDNSTWYHSKKLWSPVSSIKYFRTYSQS